MRRSAEWAGLSTVESATRAAESLGLRFMDTCVYFPAWLCMWGDFGCLSEGEGRASLIPRGPLVPHPHTSYHMLTPTPRITCSPPHSYHMLTPTPRITCSPPHLVSHAHPHTSYHMLTPIPRITCSPTYARTHTEQATSIDSLDLVCCNLADSYYCPCHSLPPAPVFTSCHLLTPAPLYLLLPLTNSCPCPCLYLLLPLTTSCPCPSLPPPATHWLVLPLLPTSITCAALPCPVPPGGLGPAWPHRRCVCQRRGQPQWQGAGAAEPGLPPAQGEVQGWLLHAPAWTRYQPGWSQLPAIHPNSRGHPSSLCPGATPPPCAQGPPLLPVPPSSLITCS